MMLGLRIKNARLTFEPSGVLLNAGRERGDYNLNRVTVVALGHGTGSHRRDYQSGSTIGGRYGSLVISDDTVRLDARH